jgi:hypothetical protein
MLEFIQQWQALIVALAGSPIVTYITVTLRQLKRESKLRDIEIDAFHYASSRVNGKFKDYTDEWQQHYNQRKEYLMTKYNFIHN